MHEMMMHEYEIAKQNDERLRMELAQKQQELDELKVILKTDYVDLLECAEPMYEAELQRLRDKRDEEIWTLIEQIFQQEEIHQVSEILKLLHRLQKINPSMSMSKYYLEQRQVYLKAQQKYLGEDVKKWTTFMRGPFYNLLFQLRTLFGEEADVVIREIGLVPQITDAYMTVIRGNLMELKSSLEYSTLWTLLVLTDRALGAVGAPFLVILVPAIRDAYVQHVLKKEDVPGMLNEWRHFRPTFVTTCLRLQITRRITEYSEDDRQRIIQFMDHF